jgi:hypothetical protein
MDLAPSFKQAINDWLETINKDRPAKEDGKEYPKITLDIKRDGKTYHFE